MTLHDTPGNLEKAREFDSKDPLASYRQQFLFPQTPEGKNFTYFTGNSLGLQPKLARNEVLQQLDAWEKMAVEGHFVGDMPWSSMAESLSVPMAKVVGAHPEEVIVMNTLTVNLHLMLVSFYRPTSSRFKILMEAGAFPSDQYALQSQVRFHGFDPEEAIIEVGPLPSEHLIRPESIYEIIEAQGDEIALVLLGQVNYLTGQAFPLEEVTRRARAKGAFVGYDLAHAAGNLELKLHDWDADFAVWCTYKYMNGGPGALAGCFVHERHHSLTDLPRFEGWWGNAPSTRFEMTRNFRPARGAAAWQLSNAPILSMAPLFASLKLFDQVGMGELRKKSVHITAYLESLIRTELPEIEVLTPSAPEERGAQLSFRFPGKGKQVQETLLNHGILCDFREPDVVRAAPAPLYNSYEDVFLLVQALKEAALIR